MSTQKSSQAPIARSDDPPSGDMFSEIYAIIAKYAPTDPRAAELLARIESTNASLDTECVLSLFDKEKPLSVPKVPLRADELPSLEMDAKTAELYAELAKAAPTDPRAAKMVAVMERTIAALARNKKVCQDFEQMFPGLCK